MEPVPTSQTFPLFSIIAVSPLLGIVTKGCKWLQGTALRRPALTSLLPHCLIASHLDWPSPHLSSFSTTVIQPLYILLAVSATLELHKKWSTGGSGSTLCLCPITLCSLVCSKPCFTGKYVNVYHLSLLCVHQTSTSLKYTHIQNKLLCSAEVHRIL